MRGQAQPERTGLAWQRTALATAVLALLLLHAAARAGWGAFTAPAALAALTAATLAVVGTRRERILRRAGEPPAPKAVSVALVAGLVTVTAFASLAVTLR